MAWNDVFMRYRVHVYRQAITQDANGVVTGATWSRVASNVACYKEPLSSTQIATIAGRLEGDNMFSLDKWHFAEDADIQAGDYLRNVTVTDGGGHVAEFGQFWVARGQAQAFASLGSLILGRKVFLASKQQTGPPGTDLTAALSGAWRFEDRASATRRDSSPEGNDLTLINLAYAESTIVKVGSGSGYFTAAGGWQHEHSAAFALGAGRGFTMHGWAYLLDKTAIRPIAAKWEGVPQWAGWVLEYDPVTDRYRMRGSPDGTDGYTTVKADNLGSPSVGAWYFVAGGFDADTGTLWIRAGTPSSLVDRTEATGLLQVFNNDQVPFTVGTNSDELDTPYFWGYLDELAYHQRSLSDDELETLWNEGDGLPYPFIS